MEEIPDQDAYSPGEAPSNGTVLEEIYAVQTENHIRISPVSTPIPIPPDQSLESAEETLVTPYKRISANQAT